MYPGLLPTKIQSIESTNATKAHDIGKKVGMCILTAGWIEKLYSSM
jgi:hypothetical protein